MRQASQGRPSWPSNDDTTLVCCVVIVGGLGFFGWLLWNTHHTAISAGFVEAAHWHIQALQRVTHAHDELDARMLAADPGRMTFAKLWEVAGVLGSVFRWPVALLLAGLGVLCFLRAAPARFTRPLDLLGLKREQAKTFRSTAAFVERQLGLVPPRDGEPRPADPALHPDEWIARYATAAGGGFDAPGARAELARQLGPLWQGVGHAAGHVRVLYAAFALHLAGRRQDALALLGDMAEALATPEPGEGPGGPEQPLGLPIALVRFADQALRDSELLSLARTATAPHGYTAPALMTLLTAARRRSGVLAPAQFNSLKLVDRRLWYALHSLGFPAEGLGQHPHPNPLVEAIGARDHWAAESLAGQPLLLPAVDRALVCVRAAAGDAGVVTSEDGDDDDEADVTALYDACAAWPKLIPPATGPAAPLPDADALRHANACSFALDPASYEFGTLLEGGILGAAAAGISVLVYRAVSVVLFLLFDAVPRGLLALRNRRPRRVHGAPE